MLWRKKFCFHLNNVRLLFMLILSVSIYSLFVYTHSSNTSNELNIKHIYNYFRLIEFYSHSTVKQLTPTRAENDDSQALEFEFNASLPLPACPLIPARLGSRIKLKLKHKPLDAILEEVKLKQPSLRLGGEWRPPHCVSRHQVAIIVPFRDRESNLELFLLNMHPFLAKQE